jgi:riboflavin kinase/FMN adenylyltransferase
LSVKVIKGIDNLTDHLSGTVATIGTFDGLHLGHQAIFKKLTDVSSKMNLQAVAITFEPHPRVLVTPDSPPLLLSCSNEKAKFISDYMSGILLILEFNKKLMNLNAAEFTQEYLLNKINIKKLIVGYDHAFGKGRSGTINDLMELSKKHDFELEIVIPVIVDGKPISSTRIRRLIMNDKFEEAGRLLGHPYPLSGNVIKGIGLGKKIGFPTANIDFSPRKLLPKDGVYSCDVEYNSNRYKGMMFIGKNHFDPQKEKSVEVNIFDFDKEIYEKELFCYPNKFIRDSKKFTETSELVEQLHRDKEKVLMIDK